MHDNIPFYVKLFVVTDFILQFDAFLSSQYAIAFNDLLFKQPPRPPVRESSAAVSIPFPVAMNSEPTVSAPCHNSDDDLPLTVYHIPDAKLLAT